jgi:hypothetical protein
VCIRWCIRRTDSINVTHCNTLGTTVPEPVVTFPFDINIISGVFTIYWENMRIFLHFNFCAVIKSEIMEQFVNTVVFNREIRQVLK